MKEKKTITGTDVAIICSAIGVIASIILIVTDIIDHESMIVGIGKIDEPSFEGLYFVIMIAMSKADDEKKFRKDMFKSKRKPVGEIWHGEPIMGVTDIVRFAPSACNTQPWIIEHTDTVLKVYRYKKQGKRGIMPRGKVSFYNQIDIGIFLCFLDLCLQHKEILYEVELYTDHGSDEEKVLNAVYKLLS